MNIHDLLAPQLAETSCRYDNFMTFKKPSYSQLIEIYISKYATRPVKQYNEVFTLNKLIYLYLLTGHKMIILAPGVQ